MRRPRAAEQAAAEHAAPEHAAADHPAAATQKVADRGIARHLETLTAPAALVLHDDETTLSLVRDAAQAAGLGVTCPANIFDLLLADPVRPVRVAVLAMTAVQDRELEVVARLRARWSGVWIVVLYPFALRERAARALALGADASLSEPFYRGEVEALFRRGLARTAAGSPEPVPAPPAAVTNAPASPAAPSAFPAERLALGVASSIRGPLRTLEHAFAAAERGGELDASEVHAELRRLAAVADGLTGFGGPPGLLLMPVDVANLVTSVFVSRDVGAAGAEIGVRLGDPEVEVLASPDLLRAGLEALRNRAVRVTPPEGKISVKTRNRVEGDAHLVEISVTDGGPALTDEERASLFEPFADAAADEEHTGLELAALAGIVRVHKGTLTVLPAGATGTIVLVRLPMN